MPGLHAADSHSRPQAEIAHGCPVSSGAQKVIANCRAEALYRQQPAIATEVSSHTDREAERTDRAASKVLSRAGAVCPPSAPRLGPDRKVEDSGRHRSTMKGFLHCPGQTQPSPCRGGCTGSSRNAGSSGSRSSL